MRKSLAMATVLIGSLVGTVAFGSEKVLFEETFDHYLDQMPGTNAKAKIQEWPPSQKFLGFYPKKQTKLFNKSIRVQAGHRLQYHE